MNFFEKTGAILAEEKKVLLEMRTQLKAKVESLPKGHIVCRKQRDREYYYLDYYCNLKKPVRSKYIGNKDKADTVQKQIDERRQLKIQLKELEEDLITIDKMLKIATKRIDKQTTQESIRGKIDKMDSPNNPNPPSQPSANHQAIEQRDIKS